MESLIASLYHSLGLVNSSIHIADLISWAFEGFFALTMVITQLDASSSALALTRVVSLSWSATVISPQASYCSLVAFFDSNNKDLPSIFCAVCRKKNKKRKLLHIVRVNLNFFQ